MIKFRVAYAPTHIDRVEAFGRQITHFCKMRCLLTQKYWPLEWNEMISMVRSTAEYFALEVLRIYQEPQNADGSLTDDVYSEVRTIVSVLSSEEISGVINSERCGIYERPMRSMKTDESGKTDWQGMLNEMAFDAICAEIRFHSFVL